MLDLAPDDFPHFVISPRTENNLNQTRDSKNGEAHNKKKTLW